MKIVSITICTILLLGLQLAEAQGRPDPVLNQMKARRDKLAMFMQGKLFPPQVIMAQQGRLNITEEQRRGIIAAVGESQTKVIEIKWETQKYAQMLGKLLDQDRIDEAEALKLINKLFQSENETKKTHFKLMVKIKNLLTSEQISTLKAVKAW